MEKLLKELAEKMKKMSVADLESLKKKLPSVLNVNDWGSDVMDGDIARWISVTQEDKMPSSHFLWAKTKETGNKVEDRKLPYKYPNGKLSRSGLRGAWAALHGDVDLDGGPGKGAMLAKCKCAIATYNRQNSNDKITISEKSDEGGEPCMKYLSKKDIADAIKDLGLDNNKAEGIITSLDNLVVEGVKKAVAEFKKTWYKPETHKKRVDVAVASAKKVWEKEVKETAEKKEKADTKFNERKKALSDAKFVMTEYREKTVRKMAIDEAGDKDFKAWLEDLEKTQKKVEVNKRKVTFKPDVSSTKGKGTLALAL